MIVHKEQESNTVPTGLSTTPDCSYSAKIETSLQFLEEPI